MLKDGLRAEKSCVCAKERLGNGEMVKSMTPSAAEADTLNSSNAHSCCGLESQPKLETSVAAPSSAGPSKNYPFKAGMFLEVLPFYFYKLLTTLSSFENNQCFSFNLSI